MKYLVLFEGIRLLMKGDKLCSSNNIPTVAIPIPHTFTTECGMALVIDEIYLDKFKELISERGIKIDIHIYE